MNNKKKLGAAFISLAVSGLAGLMLVAPGALANGPNGQGIGASVLTEQACNWVNFGVPADITLTSASTYDGTPLQLTASATVLNVYVTGAQATTSATENTRCIFYELGTDKSRPSVVMTIDDAQFGAKYGPGDGVEDTDMGINLDGTTPLVVDSSPCGVDVDNDWTVLSSLDLHNDGSAEGIPIEMKTRSDVDKVQLAFNETAGTGGQRCATTYTVSLLLPGGVEPDSPGATYTFSGITLSTVLTPAFIDAP